MRKFENSMSDREQERSPPPPESRPAPAAVAKTPTHPAPSPPQQPNPPPIPQRPSPPPLEDFEIDLVDYGDDEDPEDPLREPAIDEEGGEMVTARCAQQTLPGYGAPSSSVSPGGDHHGSGDDAVAPALKTPSAPAKPAPRRRTEAPKLKSVVVRPARAFTPPAAPTARRKTVWRRLELSSTAALPSMTLHSRSPTAASGKVIYSKPAPPAINTVLVEPVSPKWQEKRGKHWWRKDAALRCTISGEQPRPPMTAPAVHMGREAFKGRLVGRCFRCLSLRTTSSLTVRTRCGVFRCRRSGHTSSGCPTRHPRSISANLRSRLQFPPESIHSRIHFPPLPQPSTQAAAATPPNVEMEHTPGFPSRRPMLGRTAIIATDSMAREAARLLAHAVEVSMPEEGYRPTMLEVAYALSGQLRVPRHNLRVTRRNSDTFLVEFKMAPERDRAVGRGSIDIGGSSLPIRPWRSAGGSLNASGGTTPS